MAEERENQRPSQKPGQTAGHQGAGRSDDDFELHSQRPGLLDDGDPELAKLKLANDEDDDVEAHSQRPHQVGG